MDYSDKLKANDNVVLNLGRAIIDDFKTVLMGDKVSGVKLPCSGVLWRTLDSAPRDGTPVDLWHKDGFRVTEVWWADDVWSCVMDDDDFTHWMPMPPAP